ncbi:MAG TPA: sigma 54-interacting transcriptional regulator [Terriglobales bacterium]|nr:sigma 54-interacting transcriptional regulator [Terriglobales bacterium]
MRLLDQDGRKMSSSSVPVPPRPSQSRDSKSTSAAEQRHPMVNDKGDAVAAVGAIVDITERKRGQEERSANLHFWESMDRVNRAMQGADDLEQVLRDVLDALLSIFSCDRAWLVYPCDPDSGTWRTVMERTRPEFPGAFALGLDFPMDAKTAHVHRLIRASKGAMRFGAGSDNPVPSSIADRFAVQSQICMAVYPKVDNAYIFGLDQCSHPRVWGQREQKLFEEIGHRLTTALTGVLVFRSLRESEQALRRSEAYLAEGQRLSHSGSWALDVVSQKYVYVSEECLRIYGFDPHGDFPTREAVFQRIHPEDRERVERTFQRSLREKTDTSEELRIVLPDGMVKHIEVIRHPVLKSAGDVVQLVGTSVDITERKRAEEALRESEEHFRTLWDHAVDALCVFDEQHRIVDANREACEGGGYTREEVIGMVPQDFDPDIDAAMLQRIDDQIAAGQVCTFEARNRRKDGTVFPVEVRVRPFQLGGRRLHLAAARDITERKHAEEALRHSEAELAQERDRLSLLLEINNYIASKLEVDGLFEAVSASMRKHLGSDATTFWLINKDSGCLERKYIDFPSGAGFLKKVDVIMPGKLESESWRRRAPQFYSPQDTPELPAALRDAIKAEALVSRVSVPLVGATGPLGLMNMSSRQADAFSEADRDLLSQIGNQISMALENALAYGRMRASRDYLEEQRVYLESEISSEYSFEDIIGRSSAIKRVLQQVAVVAPTDSTVLLHGETGTGKELMARAIHNLSSRQERTFVRMNCAAIPSGLLESELFGHEKGAFTGALMQRRGRFELADHGTLFLDEIGDISLELQPKLLRAVQEQEFERLGSTKTIHVDVRIVAATHRDLTEMIREGKFREDLFYRLNVFPIEIPPLRERREDIPLLVNHFVSKLARRIGKKIKSISRETMHILSRNSWPGNVRELANVLERAVILTRGDELELPMEQLEYTSAPAATPMTVTVQEAERAMIMEALRASAGRISGKGGAAERLGVKRTTLQHKMRRLGINPILSGAGSSTVQGRHS